MDPALERQVETGIGFVGSDGDIFALNEVFRPATKLDLVFPGGQSHRLAVGAVTLSVEEEVGGEPFILRRINAALRVADDQAGRGRCSIIIQNVQMKLLAGLSGKEDGNVAAESQVLRPGPDVEAERGFAFSGIAAVQLD